MKKTIALFIALSVVLAGCNDYRDARVKSMLSPGDLSDSISSDEVTALINEAGETIAERINTPEGFERVEVQDGSFAAYLRSLSLKRHGSAVMYYDGKVKSADVYVAVIDMEIGDKDLQQCADSVIRLRAEYLFAAKEYDKIHFNFTSGFNADYSKWRKGNRISVKSNNVSWYKPSGVTEDYESFRKYLDIVFAYAGTLSLSKEMKQVSIEDMQIGDVFIKGGSPGHCVIVVDMAQNRETGEKLFLLAQGYMPAQDIHILKNPLNNEDNPWYSIEEGQSLDTPEWDFISEALMRFE